MSSITIVSNWLKNTNRIPDPYWVNTSSTDIVRKLIDMANAEMKAELETLMTGRKISLELQYIYETKIREWFKYRIKQKNFGNLY